MSRFLLINGAEYSPEGTVHVNKIHILDERFPVQDEYPFSLPIFRSTPSLNLTAPVTFFAGDNGTGKSTLLRAIAQACNIHVWKDEGRTRLRQTRFEDALYSCLRIEWDKEPVAGAFFAAEDFQYFTRILDEWAAADPGVLDPFGSESLVAKSHGEGHMAYFRNRFRIRGLYLLDEPENALSPRMQISLLQLFQEMAGTGNAQFIIASHSPILLACPGAEIFSFDSAPIRTTRYENTDYYRVYHDFLNDRERYFDGNGTGV